MIRRALLGAGTVALLVSACSDNGGSHVESFCALVDQLAESSPFDGLEIASPREMRDAFAELADASERVARAAPGDAAVQARRYREAIDDLRDELAVAGYDPIRLDNRAYANRVDAYRDAAISLERAASQVCA